MKTSLRFPHLKNCALLEDMPPCEKAAFLDDCIVQTHVGATEILTQGEPSPGFILIATGTVEISYLSVDGHRAIITQLSTGDAVGEPEVFAQLPCVASAVVHPNTVTLLYPSSKLRTMMRSEIFVRNVSRSYVLRMQRDNQFKAIDQFQPAEQRISSYLWHLSAEDRVVRITQSYLANVVGCSRQTVNKVLGRLRDEDLIAIRKEEIEILNPDGLGSQLTRGL
ncbi:Crp/Fnr family transcriptional regulator [Puniceibacterium sediminis]|uniref:cAMP-binding domain of CRP or a regulatory subunit of cAMP-dependent protein kinases n=1 Tax=Puniceibacterium sediminis TaxID=1608407 RepID=A0A238VHA8_9RHOB|nr:Crp/Fnr family transcriptional regulator [Puniceibacterium sediminis]SNR33477.1 cAMP-binding domain of CRP or a regulatory subunit of cAMP-dependent protein kinases [Puniceibacterium sediminis]